MSIKLSYLKHTYFVIIFFILLFLSTDKVHATEKTYSVNIEQSYASVKFSFQFDEAEYSNIVIKSPDNKLYEAELIENKLMECTINNPYSGIWTVFVSSSKNKISSIETKVRGYTEAASDVSKEITVATDIVNLKIFMVDDVLHVTWGNTSDRINVKVVDSRTLQVMDNKTVPAGSYYSLDLKNSPTEEVLVHIVPSTSAGISGAGVQYTVSVINDMDAKVSFDEISETNATSIKAYVSLEDTYRVQIVRDGVTLIETDMLPAGEYTYDLETQVGYNKYIIYIINEKEYKNTFSKTVYMDVIAPELRMENIKQSFTVTEEVYRISGFADGYETLMINNQPVTNFYDDGTFIYDYRLKEGVNNIKVVATDLSGNESISNFSIQYVCEKEEQGIGDAILAALSIALLVLLGISFMLKKRNREGTGKNSALRKAPKERSVRKNVNEDKRKNLIARSSLIKLVISLITTIAVIIVFMQYIFQVVYVTSSSMEPTLNTGDILVFNRLAYVDKEVERGDIICFWSAEEGAYYTKRVIGIPGDEISFVDGYVMINGVLYDESYVVNDMETNSADSYIVPDASYFVLGDNRENSKDSRHFIMPYIEKDDIKGKLLGSTGINIGFK